MAAISIVSGTSLNAFFHPCENLQSIAIQHTWRSASLQLLSCIAKTELCYHRAEKVGPGQRPLLSLGWAEVGQRRRREEGGSFLRWMKGQAVFFTPDLPLAPTQQQEWQQWSATSPGLWHSSSICWKSIVILAALRLDSLCCQLRSKGHWPNLLIFWVSLVS